MKTKTSVVHIRKKVLYTMMMVALCAPTVLTSSVVVAEEATPTLQGTLMFSNEEGVATSLLAETETTKLSQLQEQQTIPSISTIIETMSPFSQDEDMVSQDEATPVTIPDPALKQEILATLRLPDGTELTKADMENLTSLSLTSTNAEEITNLSGLETATNLSAFSLIKQSDITDFSPLEQLTSLTLVTIQTRSLNNDNFPDLSKNKKLTSLSLASTSIDSSLLPKIAQLIQVEILNLDHNKKITTIEPLKSMPKLNSLSIQFCGVTDFTVIPDFPALDYLAAASQNTGHYDAPTDIGRSALTYNEEAQTVFIPFKIMPNRLTNFDGYVPPFTTSSSTSNTYLDFNEEMVPENQIEITDEGITVSDITEEQYKQIESFEYNARLNNSIGSYAQPSGFRLYSISAGSYLHHFNIYDDSAPAPITVRYIDEQGKVLVPEKKLTGFIGESYEVVAETIPYYQVASVEGSVSGEFTENEQTITFVYEKIKGSVLSHYVDINGEPSKMIVR